MLQLLFLFLSLEASECEPGRQQFKNEANSDACPEVTFCARDGGDAWTSISDLSHDSSSNTLSGTFLTNKCPHAGSIPSNSEPDCKVITLPDQSTSCLPASAPTGGELAYTFTGSRIYSPFEASFSPGQACSDDVPSGDCLGGMDINTCRYELQAECENVSYGKLDDWCGGHAGTYHIHMHAACEYDVCNFGKSGHSPAIGFALDGRVIYGMWESKGAMPHLDQCNGHFGDTPATVISDSMGSTLTIEETKQTYHYHFSAMEEPFTIGCYGPVESVEECRSLYPECSDAANLFHVRVELDDGTEGEMDYQRYCPCWENDGDLWNDSIDWLRDHCGEVPEGWTDSVEYSDGFRAATGANVIILITDDFVFYDVPEIPSDWNGDDMATYLPNLKQMREESIIFSNAFTTSPHCAPARSATLTGRYVSSSEAAHAENCPKGLCPTGMGTANLNEREMNWNIGKVFQNAGYYTCFIGKWHLGNPSSGGGSWWNFKTENNEHVQKAGFNFTHGLYMSNPSDEDGTQHNNEWLTAGVLKCIDNALANSVPFFIWWAPTSPHTPQVLDALCEDIEKTPYGDDDFSPDEFPTVSRGLRDSVQANCDGTRNYRNENTNSKLGSRWVDESVADVENHLVIHSLKDSTAFLFNYDHGTQKMQLSYKAAKILSWLRYPPLTDSMQGQIYDGLVSQIDFGPMLTFIAGIESHYQFIGENILQVDESVAFNSWQAGDSSAVTNSPLKFKPVLDRTVMVEWDSDRLGMSLIDGTLYMILETSTTCEAWELTDVQTRAVEMFDNIPVTSQYGFFDEMAKARRDNDLTPDCAIQLGTFPPTAAPASCDYEFDREWVADACAVGGVEVPDQGVQLDDATTPEDCISQCESYSSCYFACEWNRHNTRCFVYLSAIDSTATHPRKECYFDPSPSPNDISATVSLDLTSDWMKNQQVSDTNLLLSYEAPSTELWSVNRAYSYGNAVAVIGWLLRGRAEDFDSAQSVLMAMSSRLDSSGQVPFSFDTINGQGAEPYRTGAAAWVAYAFALWELITGDTAFAATLDNICDWMVSMQASSGCISGGPDVDWCSTEHNIDAFFAFHLAGWLHSSSTFQNTAETIRTVLVSENMWDSDSQRFNQGYDDSTDTLDAQSWGSLFLMGGGEGSLSDIIGALEYTDRFYGSQTSILNGAEAYGWGPYERDLTVWSEGSYGVALALERFLFFQDSTSNVFQAASLHGRTVDDLLLDLAPLVRDDGAVLYAGDTSVVSDWDDTFYGYPSITSAGWRLIVESPAPGRELLFFNADATIYGQLNGVGFNAYVTVTRNWVDDSCAVNCVEMNGIQLSNRNSRDECIPLCEAYSSDYVACQWNTNTLDCHVFLDNIDSTIRNPRRECYYPISSTQTCSTDGSSTAATDSPTVDPTKDPTLEPTSHPTSTDSPTFDPTKDPTLEPTSHPTLEDDEDAPMGDCDDGQNLNRVYQDYRFKAKKSTKYEDLEDLAICKKLAQEAKVMCFSYRKSNGECRIPDSNDDCEDRALEEKNKHDVYQLLPYCCDMEPFTMMEADKGCDGRRKTSTKNLNNCAKLANTRGMTTFSHRSSDNKCWVPKDSDDDCRTGAYDKSGMNTYELLEEFREEDAVKDHLNMDCICVPISKMMAYSSKYYRCEDDANTATKPSGKVDLEECAEAASNLGQSYFSYRSDNRKCEIPSGTVEEQYAKCMTAPDEEENAWEVWKITDC